MQTLMPAAAFKDATNNFFGTREGTGMDTIDKALGEYHAGKYDGADGQEKHRAALSKLQQTVTAWHTSDKAVGAHPKRKDGVTYLGQQIAQIQRESFYGAPEKKAVTQLQDKASPGLFQQIGSAIGSIEAPSARTTADALNAGRISANVAAKGISSSSTPSMLKELGGSSSLAREVGAGLGMGSSLIHHCLANDSGEAAKTAAGREIQRQDKASGDEAALGAYMGTMGTAVSGLGDLTAGAGIGLGADVLVGAKRTAEQVSTARATSKVNDSVQKAAKGATLGEGVSDEDQETFKTLHDLHSQGQLVGKSGDTLAVGGKKMDRATAQDKYQAMRAQPQMQDYIQAKSLGEIGSYAKKWTGRKAAITGVETVGAAADLAGTFTAGADLGATKIAGKTLKYGAKGTRAAMSGVKKYDKVKELAQLKQMVDGKERGKGWHAQMMLSNVDDKLAEMRERLSGTFRNGHSQVKWHGAVDGVAKKSGYEQSEIGRLQTPREERQARQLMTSAANNNAHAAGMLEAMSIPVPTKDDLANEEATKATVDLYKRAVAP